MNRGVLVVALCALGVSLVAGAPAEAKVRGKVVSYKAGKTTLKGYLAYDAAKKGKRPGVIVVHEWWGHNDYARRRARMLAKLGYIALAIDMYGDGKNTGPPKDAKRVMMAATKSKDVAIARFMAGLKLLRANKRTAAKKVAAIGYCFGGAVVLNMARTGVDLRAVASFHGNLGPMVKAKKGGIKAEILVLHGAADPFVPEKQIAAFKKEMKDVGAKMTFMAYPGAKHAFTNPVATAKGKKYKLPLAYDKSADTKSWAAMKRFFARVLR